MIKVWDRNLFDWSVMIEWNERPTIQKDFTNAVAYFNKHLVAIETFEAADGHQGCNMLLQRRYSICLCALEMPVIDSKELLGNY